jgi:hypothetical protein
VTRDFGQRLRLGPDEVHNRAIARIEMKKYTNAKV